MSEARLASFMEHSPGSLFIKDAAGRYVVVNRAFLAGTGMSSEQVLGRTDAELFPPELADPFVESDREVSRSGEARQSEDTFTYQGRAYTFLSQKFPLPDGHLGASGPTSPSASGR